jgi:hypothetical protein
MPCMRYEKPPIKQGALDRSFLLDTVRHISRHVDFVIKQCVNLNFEGKLSSFFFQIPDGVQDRVLSRIHYKCHG